MQYRSTRDKSIKMTSAQAIAQGLSRDGGLFVPESFPFFPTGMLERMTVLPYVERAVTIMKLFLDDFTENELRDYAAKAYGYPNFDHRDVAPVVKTAEHTSFLELWHGPTCAFKDVALQMLPHLLSASLDKTGETKDACVLVATSGDTGKAALEGFCDVPRTKIMVFYPEDGVSDVQKLQMTTQQGGNVGVAAVTGNFDDAQTGVKKIFSDEKMRERLNARGYFLSSANSINWGRLLPQMAYYVSAYCDMVKSGDIAMGDNINFCVPTGNFGNILAGYYAKKIGLPIGRLICASNCNDVLTEFIETGVYNRNRAFMTTISPSMDILVSSNLERLLFDLSGGDDARVASYMKALPDEGRYTVSGEIMNGVKSHFSCGRCSDAETKATIREMYKKEHYLIDTHTAVAYNVLQSYRSKTGDMTKTVVVSTASPFKFCDSVLEALGENTTLSGLDLIDRLATFTGVRAPEPLRTLRGKAVRFSESFSKDKMPDVVEQFLA
ncbi:threonine synthase [Sporobacter termitidis DSM 10068]|uniref:Threonine synthase n=1 Tax=Sporobacter termitidis DSM 10068 TaxID=1123282 RepID=A0A1M5TKR8_9FIRM|nr:threonine synthase [Sporobacter termitidis]SHH51294.1 threonine synthase [Sporobacter termitidis DSM 10068]